MSGRTAALLFPLTPGVRFHLRTPQLPPASRECVPCLSSISTLRPVVRARCMNTELGPTPPVPILASGAFASLSMTARCNHGRPVDPVPDVLTAIAADPTGWEVVAHGNEFDRAIYEHILVPRHGFPHLPLDIQHCSMSLALANAYPAELARLCSALDIKYQKDREGALLIRKMARPRKTEKGEQGIHWLFDAEKLARLSPTAPKTLVAVAPPGPIHILSISLHLSDSYRSSTPPLTGAAFTLTAASSRTGVTYPCASAPHLTTN